MGTKRAPTDKGMPSAFQLLAPALRARGFDARAVTRGCGMLRTLCGDPVRVLAAYLAGLGAADPSAYAARLLRGEGPSDAHLADAKAALTPEPEPGALDAALTEFGRVPAVAEFPRAVMVKDRREMEERFGFHKPAAEQEVGR